MSRSAYSPRPSSSSLRSAAGATSGSRMDSGTTPTANGVPATQTYTQQAWVTYTIKSSTLFEVDKTRVRFLKDKNDWTQSVKLPKLLEVVRDTITRDEFVDIHLYHRKQIPHRLQDGQVHTVPVLFTVSLQPNKWAEISEIKYVLNTRSGAAAPAGMPRPRDGPGETSFRGTETHGQRRRRLHFGSGGSRR